MLRCTLKLLCGLSIVAATGCTSFLPATIVGGGTKVTQLPASIPAVDKSTIVKVEHKSPEFFTLEAVTGDANGESPKEANGECDKCKEHKSPEALFEWAIGRDAEEEDDDSEESKPLIADRPDFTESSSAVGKGRIQLEMGYTYVRDRDFGQEVTTHSYPEILVRLGLFTDWFELRIGQNFGNERTHSGGTDAIANGAEDLFLGFRFDLTEQKGWLPESSFIYQMTVPTGDDDFTTNEVMPGAALFYSWELIPDCLTLAGGTQVNRAQDDSNDFYLEFAQSVSLAYTLTERVGSYTEWFAFVPSGARDFRTGPAHFLNGGFTYAVTDNFQLDVRAGFGLNQHADDFFTGTGFVVRY